MLFSKSTSLGLQSLFIMYKHNPAEYYSVAELSRSLECSKTYLNKIMKNLVAKGILESKTGPGAGYRFKRDPREIKLIEIVNILNNPDYMTACFFALGECSDDAPCPLHFEYEDFRNNILHKLNNLSIAKGAKEGWHQLVMRKD